jgi:hypothetical protein
MMELRQASKDEAQAYEKAANNANIGSTISKLTEHAILGVTGFLNKLSENCKIYNIIHY